MVVCQVWASPRSIDGVDLAVKVEPVIPRDRNDTVCPFLGQVVETGEHVCLANDERGEEIRLPYVRSYCLKARHVSCRFFIRASPATKRLAFERRQTASMAETEMAGTSPPSISESRPKAGPVRQPVSPPPRGRPKIESEPRERAQPLSVPARRSVEAARERWRAPARTRMVTDGSDEPNNTVPVKPVQAGPAGVEPVDARHVELAPVELAPVEAPEVPVWRAMDNAGLAEPGTGSSSSVRPVSRETVVEREPFQSAARTAQLDTAGPPQRVIARPVEPDDMEIEDAEPHDLLHMDIAGDAAAAEPHELAQEEEAPAPVSMAKPVDHLVDLSSAIDMAPAGAVLPDEREGMPPAEMPPLPYPETGDSTRTETPQAKGTQAVAVTRQDVPPRKRRRWFVMAVIGAALVVAALLVGIALVLAFRLERTNQASTVKRPAAATHPAAITSPTTAPGPTTAALPNPGTNWHFPPLHTAADQVILTLSNANSVPARIQIRRHGTGLPVTTVRVAARGEAEMELPAGEHASISIRSSMPILTQRIVIKHGRASPTLGLPGPGK